LETGQGILAQERCIRQLALTAEKNAKFHSNQQKESPSIAEIVTRNTKDSKVFLIG
jgi:hypothetical protein